MAGASQQPILITGGSGFIGRHLCAALAERYRVFAPTHQELELTNGDQVSRYISHYNIQGIVHCAYTGPGSGRAGMLMAENLRMFFNLTRFAPRCQVIHLGSGAEYDKSRPLIKVQETAFGERVPADDYGLFKYIIGHHIEAHHGMVNLRLFGVFGPGEDYLDDFISNAIAKNLTGRDIVIHKNTRFNYLWVQDLAPIVDHFINHKARWPSYNVVPDESVDLVSIGAAINHFATRPSKIAVMLEGMNLEYTGDNSRLRQEIPNLTFTSTPNGIAQLYQHFQSRVQKLDASALDRDDYLARVIRIHPASTSKG